MTRISAAENIVIDMQDGRWRLMNANGTDQTDVLAEAVPGEALRYGARFGTTRRLPTSGQIGPGQIQQIVAGWSHEDASWHLGLLLGPELAEARGSRWCEIAYWPDPDVEVFMDLAKSAGESLGRILAIPFHLVPPTPAEKPAPLPPPPLPERVGVWNISQSGANILFHRESGWRTAHYRRIGWYVLWMVVYIVVSTATLTSKLALPNSGTLLPDPRLLPFLGLATAALLLGLIVRQIMLLGSRIDRVEFHQTERIVSAWHSEKQRWQKSGADVQSVYVSEVLKRKDKTLATYHGELNLHFGGGIFFRVLEQERQEDHPDLRRNSENIPTRDEVLPLMTENAQTPLQITGLHIAKLLGDHPAWHDVRVK